jgi:hypothetical protein
LLALLGDFCVSCGFVGYDTLENRLELESSQLGDWQARWKTRLDARAAVDAGIAITAEDVRASFPHPYWLPPFRLCETMTAGALLEFRDVPHLELRRRLRGIFGVPDNVSSIVVDTALQPITVDDVYFNHLFEIAAGSGKDRIDADHIAYVRLTSRTLLAPLEVWQQQTGGIRTRKTVFLSAYQIDAEFTYHVVVVTARNTLLTAYRLNGGRRAFEETRFGVPLYVRY